MSNIKNCFTSRWMGGSIIEADYSQLEVIVLAHLSGDKQMIRDVIAGVDMHTVRAAELFDIPERDVTKEQRKVAKSFSFELQYGAGYKSMAEKNGTSERTAKNFIENFYLRYPDVLLWQQKIKDEVLSSRKPSIQRTVKGIPAGVGEHVSSTGRVYKFYEEDNPYYNPSYGKSKEINFSPTKMKNYPVQGFATGDIVPMMLGVIFRKLSQSKYKGSLLMINTVHDSIVFDCKYTDMQTIKEACIWIKDLMENAPAYLKAYFDIDFELPLSVGVEVGRSWGELKELTLP